MEERVTKRDLDRFGMAAQAPVLRIDLGSSGVTGGGPNDAVEAAEDGLRSPEASESENGGLQWPVGRRIGISRGFGDAIWNSYAQRHLRE